MEELLQRFDVINGMCSHISLNILDICADVDTVKWDLSDKDIIDVLYKDYKLYNKIFKNEYYHIIQEMSLINGRSLLSNAILFNKEMINNYKK